MPFWCCYFVLFCHKIKTKWNIIESGVKHHNHNIKIKTKLILVKNHWFIFLKFVYCYKIYIYCTTIIKRFLWNLYKIQLEAQWASLCRSPVILFWGNYTELSIGQSHIRTAYGGYGNFVQAKQFQRRFFRNWPTRNKNCLWAMAAML